MTSKIQITSRQATNEIDAARRERIQAARAHHRTPADRACNVYRQHLAEHLTATAERRTNLEKQMRNIAGNHRGLGLNVDADLAQQ